ncbi:SRPBCC family protein [Lentzea albidocapillata]|uniref:SRPBCC family protein n=1 Tax=Lentzea albidocapillata TaxID=40571 RepID=UPI001C40922F|nr:hypothetical protein [Lentzea albidocapillata]
MTRFEIIAAIAAPPRRVFDLSLAIETHTVSMAGSGERVIGGVCSGRMKLGDTVTWQARHFGFRWRMTSVISVYDPPGHFVDEQVEARSSAGATSTTSSQTGTAEPSCETSSTSPHRLDRSALLPNA